MFARDGGRRASFGRGLEPELLRRYQYGDDVRRIDWAATLRLQRPMVRQTLPVAAGVLRIVVDASPSMATHTPSWHQLQRFVAAIGVVAMAAGDRVEAYVDPDEVAVFVDVSHWLRWCSTMTPHGMPWRLPALPASPHPLVLCGDLLHSEWSQVLTQAHACASQTVLCHWQIDDAAHLADDGEYEFIDSETAEKSTVRVDATLRQRYQHARQTWYAEVQTTCRELGVRYIAVPPTTAIMTLMAEVVQ